MRPVRRGVGARRIRVLHSGAARNAVRARLPQYSPAQIEEAFLRGDILDVHSSPLTPDSPVRRGEDLWAFAPIIDEPATPIHLEILKSGRGWMCVDKPHGLATMPRGSHVASTVTVAARRQFSNDTIVAVHRLDAATAGVLLLSTIPDTRACLHRLFERGRVEKTYLAIAPLVSGGVSEQGMSEKVELRIVKERSQPRARVVPGSANAVTWIRLLDSYGPLGLYEVRPLTGKTHQIRLTFAHMGIPILGDVLYGAGASAPMPYLPEVCNAEASSRDTTAPVLQLPRLPTTDDISARSEVVIHSSERSVELPCTRDAHDSLTARFPLQLLAQRLHFTDPTTGDDVEVTSTRTLVWPEK